MCDGNRRADNRYPDNNNLKKYVIHKIKKIKRKKGKIQTNPKQKQTKMTKGKHLLVDTTHTRY
jgi:protein-disulfide isomerase-like protein with CxxC motif